MSVFSSYKKIFLLGFILVILIAIPFSVYIAQKRQKIITKAAQSTTLSFDPAQPTVKVNDILTLNISIDPGTGASANQVSFVKLSINFDKEKFTTAGASLVPNPSSSNTLTSILEDPVFKEGKASISLSIGADPARAVKTATKFAVLKLKAESTTDSNNPSIVTFGPDTQVLSIADSDQTSENVLSLSTTIPARVTITNASSSTSTGATPTATPAPSSSSPANTPTPISIVSFPTATVIQPIDPEIDTDISPTLFPEISETTELLPTTVELPPTGSSEKMIGLGILGTILTIIGGIIFISL